jgi:hypothetical protein
LHQSPMPGPTNERSLSAIMVILAGRSHSCSSGQR